MSLVTCIKTAGSDLSTEDKSAILALRRNHIKDGVPILDAGMRAIEDHATTLRTLLDATKQRHSELHQEAIQADLEKQHPAPAGEANAPYAHTIFGEPLPEGAAPPRPSGAVPRDTEAPGGTYGVRTVVGTAATKELGSDRITTPGEAASATRYLYKSAVERFDGIVVDKDGKPLAVVGGFKGAVAETHAHPATIVAEAVRVPGAAGIWFSHNHPSGRAELSEPDLNLNRILSDSFRGSGIEPHGILAIGKGKFDYVDENGAPGGAHMPIPEHPGRSTVPVVERELAPESTNGEEIRNMAEARVVAGRYYKDNGNQPGLILLDAQHRVVAWVPLPKEALGALRGTGGLKSIYRAVSESNASRSILVHGGELDAKIPGTNVTYGENIGAALDRIKVAPLDIVNGKTGSSAVAAREPTAAGPVYSRAYHGSPSRFDRFSTEHIGSGEGAQAYGYGLYFASKREIAEHYRTTLSAGNFPSFEKDGKVINSPVELAREYYMPGNIVRAYGGADKVLRFHDNQDGTWSVQAVGVRANGEPMRGQLPRWHRTFPDDANLRSKLEEQGWKPRESGQLYEAEIPDDDHMLQWDKPLSEQPQAVRESLEPFLAQRRDEMRQTLRVFGPEETEKEIAQSEKELDGQGVYQDIGLREGGDKAASEALLAAGIKGINYLDNTSRSAGEGSHNYVVFSHDDVEIKNQFYSRMRGAASQTVATQATLRDALSREFGEPTIAALERSGLLDVAQRPPEGTPSDVAGKSENGRVSLYAENMPLGSTAVAYHEALHNVLRRSIGDEAYAGLMDRIGELHGDRFFDEARGRLPADTPEGLRNEELAAYAVEQYQLNREAMPDGIRKWASDFIAALKAGLAKALNAAGIGKKLQMKLLSDPAVLHRIAADGLRAMAREGAGEADGAAAFSRKLPNQDEAPSEKRGPLRDAMRSVSDAAKVALNRGVYDLLTPMSSGSHPAQAAAQAHINAERDAYYRWGKFAEKLTDTFDPEQRKGMWNAGDQENDIRSGRKADGPGLAGLPADQRSVVELMNDLANNIFQRGKADGFIPPDAGKDIKFWTPRMMVRMSETGDYANPGGAPGGSNVVTSAPSLMRRKYKTAAETEAAMQEKGGELLRDIGTVPIALARLQRALAGRALVEKIKEIGQLTGEELISSTPGKDYFTDMNVPAFRRANGMPIYIRKDWEGPLRAIMSQDEPAAYRAYMLLKSKAMTGIMISPAIHNMVIFGRAMAIAGVKTPALYFIGHGARQDIDFMSNAIRHGAVFASGSNHTMMTPSDLARGFGKEGGWFDPNESWIGKGLQVGGNLFNKGLGDSLKSGVDKAGDILHGTLLWERVADLQAGIIKSIYDKARSIGMDDNAAMTVAADLGNRYGGTMPRENMSQFARMVANILLFSRSFTLGNIATAKDVVFGLPSGLRAQLESKSSPQSVAMAMMFARKKAAVGLVRDLAYTIILTSAVQDFVDRHRDDSWMQNIGDAFAQLGSRGETMWQNIKQNPVDPSKWNPYQLSSAWANEPGKEDRIDLGPDESGRHQYLRLPTGKSIEDNVGWITHPWNTLENKLSPTMKWLDDMRLNDKSGAAGYHIPVYDEHSSVLSVAADIAKHLVETHTPFAVGQSAMDIARGAGTKRDADLLAGQASGFTTSQGNPAGPLAGVEQMVKDRIDQQKRYAMELVKRDLKYGDEDTAMSRLTSIGLTDSEAMKAIRGAQMKSNGSPPSASTQKQRLRDFNKHANEMERAKMLAVEQQK